MPYKAGALYPCNPATERAVSTKLGVDPEGEKLVYTNGRAVIIRDLKHTSLAHAYTQHTQNATVARISPSGYYCASGDIAGNVRIWDIMNAENILKLATRPLGGRINDLAWDGESKRIIVGGEGKEGFGAAFMMDSGSTVGGISGHGKPINAVSVRHQRPFRAVSASDDNAVIFHTAVPFKYDKTLNEHTKFVQDVAFSPNGDLFVSVGSDGKVVFYEGKDGAVKGAPDTGSSAASLMACSWASDSSKVATAGADGVVTLWDASTMKSSQSYKVGSDVASQQNGVVFAGSDTVISVSMSGVLNMFDLRESSSSKWRTINGPSKSITASTLVGEDKEKTLYAGSFDGSVKAFDIGSSYGEAEGDCNVVEGTGHSGRVASMTSDGKGKIYSAGWDDRVSTIEKSSFTSASISAKGQPAGIAATPSAIYVASSAGLSIHPQPSGSVINQSGATTAVAAHAGPNEDLVAFSSAPKKVSLARVTEGAVKVDAEFEDNKSEVLAMAFSPNGGLLAAGDSTGRIVLVDTNKKEAIITSKWTFHTGRITCLNFSADGKRLVSSALDESIYIWEIDKPLKNTAIKNAHPGGVSSVAWSEGSTKIVSTGSDGCVRTWTVDQL